MDQPANEENVIYGIVASGPAVNPVEVETEETALEVVVTWGEQSVLQVSHLARGGAFVVGDDAEDLPEGGAHFLVPTEVVGASRLQLASVDGGGRVEVLVPPGASAESIRAGDVSPLPPGLHVVADDARLRVVLGSFAFVFRSVRAGRRVAASREFDRRPWGYLGATAFFAALTLAIFHLMPPTSSALSVSDLRTGSRLVDFVVQANSTEPPPPTFLDEGGGGGEPSQSGPGPQGEAGDETAEQTGHRVAVQGRHASEATQLARDPGEYIRENGVIGALRAMAFSGAASSPFGAEQAIGSDAVTALGALLGTQPGASRGQGGLDMLGTGRGGRGGPFATFGSSRFGDLTRPGGRGPGTGTGTGPGGPGLHGRESRGPQITPQPVEVANPGLSADAIRRVVRRHLNEVRFCYEQGLQRRGDLQGRVVTSFLIGPTGSVGAAVASPDSTLSDGGVKSCVAQAVRRWAFPAPNNGQVIRVTYPFTFTPS